MYAALIQRTFYVSHTKILLVHVLNEDNQTAVRATSPELSATQVANARQEKLLHDAGVCFSYRQMTDATKFENIPSSFTFSGAFAKSQKATISFVMSVRPSVRTHETTRFLLEGCGWNLIFELLFRKSVEKIQVSLKSEKNNGYFTYRSFHIYDNILLNSSQNDKCFT